MKNANQIYWKEYRKQGGTLSFKEWMDREKKKGFVNLDGATGVPENRPLTDSIQKTLDAMHRGQGFQDQLGGKYVLGVHRTFWICLGVAAAATVGIIIYQKTKN